MPVIWLLFETIWQAFFCFVSLFYRNSTKNAENINEITFSEKRRKSIEFTNI